MSIAGFTALPRINSRLLFGRVVTALTLCCLAVFVSANTVEVRKGRFIGSIVAEWLGDGRKMKLREPFGYRSPDGQAWHVPENTVVDGATIPSFLWSLTGGPFEGRYRAASVIHDHYCNNRARPWQDVHRVFYDAMVTSGVGPRRAWLMYKAVETFGPRWTPAKSNPTCLRADGTLDLEQCTQNSEGPKPKLKWPQRDAKDIAKFLERMEGAADPADIQHLSLESKSR